MNGRIRTINSQATVCFMPRLWRRMSTMLTIQTITRITPMMVHRTVMARSSDPQGTAAMAHAGVRRGYAHLLGRAHHEHGTARLVQELARRRAQQSRAHGAQAARADHDRGRVARLRQR